MKRISKFGILTSLALVLAACGGGGGGGSSAPSVPMPSVTITTSAQKVWINDPITITWTSSNTTTCSGSDGIAGIQPISGSFQATPTVSGQSKFTLTCTGPGGSTVNSQIVLVEDPIKTFVGQYSSTGSASPIVVAPFTQDAGIFRFNNGVWGVNSAINYIGSMEGTVDVKNSSITSAKFAWEATSSATPGIVAFNNVTIGKHPGWTSSTSAKFPVQVGSMPVIKVEGDIKTVCLTTCAYGTIMNAFVMANANATANEVATTPNIGTEFLVVTENSDGGPNPYTNGYVGNSTINGVEYKVYYNAFKSNWNNVGYSPINQKSSLNINLKDLMQDALNRGYIKSSDFLMSVELGTEVVFGKGTTTITKMTVN